ncbi:hypothetical protein [Novosphingobium sp. AAP83]|uniref:hypothetical protein n=1 Tax=Novosphingobium sp. AAP83 TaxID=1523425 RepID=UPI000AFDB252|nr:hypothetical protein [Novosphingobium sp. AAP83]
MPNTTQGLSAQKRAALSVLALVLPVLAGLAWMIVADAPLRLVATNLAALTIALVIIALPGRFLHTPATALLCASVMVLTAIAGTEVDNVRRWFALGPLHLHSGMMFLPLFIVTLPLLPVILRLAALALALFATLFQPDLAMTLSLLGATVFAPANKAKRFALGIAIAALLAGVMFDRPQPAPVAFVERVIAQAWGASTGWFLVLLAGQIAMLGIALSAQTQGRALAGFWAGCTIASMIAPYPSPLIGGGAAPIIGFGLALCAMRATQRIAAQGVGKRADLA